MVDTVAPTWTIRKKYSRYATNDPSRPSHSSAAHVRAVLIGGVACQQFVSSLSADGTKLAGIGQHQMTRNVTENVFDAPASSPAAVQSSSPNSGTLIHLTLNAFTFANPNACTGNVQSSADLESGFRSAQAGALCRAAAEVGVGLYPVSPFYEAPPPRAGLLLGYAALDERDIRIGVERLARLVSQRRDKRIGRQGR
jgi:hypothetical protein